MGSLSIFHLIVIDIIVLVICVIVIMMFCKKRASRANESRFQKSLKEMQELSGIGEYVIDDLILVLVGLNQFALNINSIRTQSELNKLIVQYACRLMNVESASIMLINQKGELTITESVGVPQAIVEKAKVKLGDDVSGYVAQTGKALLVKDIESDIRIKRKNNTRYPSKSFVCVPMRKRNQIIGVLNVNSNDSAKYFNEKDVRILTILSEQAGVILENIELSNNLKNFYVEFVQTLSRAIDAKDHYTCDHASRTRVYASMLAKKFNLPDNIVTDVEYAALMHDIGKIGIDDNILQKAGKLSKEEHDAMKKHPAIGSKIISPVSFLSPVATIVLYHQEWFDGTGYPEGLKGEGIPLGARIVSVIDAYDSMTTDRTYRESMGVNAAVAELRKFSGTQFDPKVVESFIEVLIEQNIYQQ